MYRERLRERYRNARFLRRSAQCALHRDLFHAHLRRPGQDVQLLTTVLDTLCGCRIRFPINLAVGARGCESKQRPPRARDASTRLVSDHRATAPTLLAYCANCCVLAFVNSLLLSCCISTLVLTQPLSLAFVPVGDLRHNASRYTQRQARRECGPKALTLQRAITVSG